MKKLLLLALLFPVICVGQTPNKWDDTVILYGDKVDIIELGKFLMKSGVEVLSVNEKIGLMHTDYIQVPKSLYRYRLTIKQQDGKLHATAFIRKVSGGKLPQASWVGSAKAVNKVTFYHMYYLLKKYADTIDGSVVTVKLK